MFDNSLLRFMEADIDQIKGMIRRKNQREKRIVDVPKPFLKWAGGKRQIITQMAMFIPRKFGTYIEPFLGGAAIFFYLMPQKAILIDINEELINVYRVIQEDVKELIRSLKKHRNERDYYYKNRNLDRNPKEFKKLSPVERASRTIFLNRTCYNGLYRVNSKGEFNVPFGRYKNPNYCNEKNLWAVHTALKNVKLIHGSFEACLEFAKKDDFVYFDPPYAPISDSANFTSYTKDNFGKEDQLKLREVFEELDKRGCKLMLSNSYNNFILKLYADYKIIVLKARRAINRDGMKRGEIKEILVVNS
ncbi:MAG: DNA adenine methylase [Promethearchaeota archaeon]